MIALGVLRIEGDKKNCEIGMVNKQDKKVEVCMYQYTVGGLPKMILTKSFVWEMKFTVLNLPYYI